MTKKERPITVSITISYKGEDIAYNDTGLSDDALKYDLMYSQAVEGAIVKMIGKVADDAKEEYDKINDGDK